MQRPWLEQFLKHSLNVHPSPAQLNWQAQAPVLGSHRPRPLQTRPLSADLGHTGSAHDLPENPGSHWHVPLGPHTPLPLHSSGHCSIVHPGPVHPGRQVHVPLLQAPLSEQPLGHSLERQETPSHPGMHWHLPDDTQWPRLEPPQSALHATWPQSAPFQPGLQKQAPLTQLPRPIQLFGHLPVWSRMWRRRRRRREKRDIRAE